MKRFVGERRAVAAAVLAFYSFLYLIATIFPPGPDLERAMGAMASVYAIGFFGVVAGYFWARWYAIGVGLQGVITSAVGIWQIGAEPVLLFFGATHAAISIMLWGDGVAGLFDGRLEWRTRFHLDENAVHRLGRSVIRIGISLPFILLYAFAPKGLDLVAVGAAGFALAGMWGVFRMRTWGVVALAAATGLLAVAALSSALAAIGAALLGSAVVPFGRPVIEYLRSR